jgi:hypothetical protein
MSQPIHASIPSPLRHEMTNTGAPAFTIRTPRLK